MALGTSRICETRCYVFDRPVDLLTTQVAVLSSQIAGMNNGDWPNFEAVAFYTGERSSMEEARFINNNRGYAGYRVIYYSNQYHPSLHNHEKFLYASNSTVWNPPGFDTPMDERKPSLKFSW